jgi:hypothetical protein
MIFSPGMNPSKTFRLAPAPTDAPLAHEATRLLIRELTERAGLEVIQTPQNPDLSLHLIPGSGPGSYRIENEGAVLRIIGHDPAGLLYGVGRFLHSAVSGDGTFSPSTSWRGTSTPACQFRGLYFAHNFHNWYRSAPQADVIRYVEDLALWGLNAIAFPFDTNPHCPADEIEKVMLPRQLELIQAAKRVGIRTGMITVANTLLTVPTAEVAATPVPDAQPERRGNIGNRVCPSHPQGFALLASRFNRSLEAYRMVGLDFVVAFPYDEGGCGCAECRPWGGKGFIKACRELSRQAKAKFPDCRFIAGTWCFDVLDKPEGEFEGLDREIRANPGWCDEVMCDAHGDFPRWPLEQGSPGGLPMINFAEISMWGRWPWGGSGANPYPHRIARIWRQARHLLTGGLPYSEGCFEDINKVMCLNLFWDKAADADQVTRDYLGYEFGPAAVDKMAEAIRLMEDIYPPECRTFEKAQKVFDLIQEAATTLPAKVLSSWRWRILYLRAVIDFEAVTHPGPTGVVSDKQNEAYEELVRLYSAQHSQSSITPIARSVSAHRQ